MKGFFIKFIFVIVMLFIGDVVSSFLGINEYLLHIAVMYVFLFDLIKE